MVKIVVEVCLSGGRWIDLTFYRSRESYLTFVQHMTSAFENRVRVTYPISQDVLVNITSSNCVCLDFSRFDWILIKLSEE